MKNIKLAIEYDGTNYNGWQRQTGHKVSAKQSEASPKGTKTVRSKTKPPRRGQGHRLRTIQEEIEKAIEKISRTHSHLYASGRTDAGVHAKAQVANFHTSSNISPYRLRHSLNALLSDDISIKEAEYVDENFHSRFSAKSKTYRYTILNRKARSPLLERFSFRIPYDLDLALMKKESLRLLGKHDFKSFKASGIIEKNTIRTIKRIIIKKNKDSVITIDIEADGFLHNMVRNIVGTLIEIARGKFAPGSMEKILKAKDRTHAGPTAPAKGLCLMEVRY